MKILIKCNTEALKLRNRDTFCALLQGFVIRKGILKQRLGFLPTKHAGVLTLLKSQTRTNAIATRRNPEILQTWICSEVSGFQGFEENPETANVRSLSLCLSRQNMKEF